MALYKRYIEIQIGTVKVTELEVDFTVVRTLGKDPNTLTASIYNLSPTLRGSLQALPLGNAASTPTRVSLSAGYVQDRVTNLFLGDLRSVSHTKDGSGNIITTIEAGDGERSTGIQFAKSYGPNTSLSTVLGDLVDAIQVGRGNIDQIDSLVGNENGSQSAIFPNGVVVSGYAMQTLAELLEGAGLGWSIQDSRIQVTRPSGAVITGTGTLVPAVDLGPSTGLLGAPSMDNKGVLRCQTLIIPDLVPGKYLKLTSNELNGTFLVTRAEASGSYFGNEFFIMLEAKRA